MKRLITYLKYGLIILSFISCEQDPLVKNTDTSSADVINHAPKISNAVLKRETADSLMNILMNANKVERFKIIENFEAKTGAKLADTEVLKNFSSASSPTYNEVIDYTTPYGQSRGVYGSEGASMQDVNWIIIENLFGWWQVKSYERVTATWSSIDRVDHMYSVLVGVTLGILEWEQTYVSITGTPPSDHIVAVWGLFKISGVGNTERSNYCIIRPSAG